MDESQFFLQASHFVDASSLIALSFLGLILLGIAGITHTVLRVSQGSLADVARFVVIAMYGMVLAIGAYLPILLGRLIEHPPAIVFQISTFVLVCAFFLAARWSDKNPQIKRALDRMRRESQYPKSLTLILVGVGLILALMNIASWPFQSNQTFYEILLIFGATHALFHFINLVIFRIVDNAILENPINAGWEAVIYDVPDDPGKVLKLFNFYSKSDAENEVRMTKSAADAGLPCPTVFGDVVEMNDRVGFYMEKIHGQAFANQGIYGFGADAKELSEEFAQFHVKLHEIEGVEMPLRFKDVAGSYISNSVLLTLDERSKILELLDSLPDGDRVYHGDFHPGNVMRRNDTGELVIVDWVRAMTGHPLADVSRTTMILSTAWMEFFPGIRVVVRRAIQTFTQRYEEAYFENSDFENENMEPWRIVVAAMRIGEIQSSTRASKQLLKQVRKYLAAHESDTTK